MEHTMSRRLRIQPRKLLFALPLLPLACASPGAASIQPVAAAEMTSSMPVAAVIAVAVQAEQAAAEEELQQRVEAQRLAAQQAAEAARVEQEQRAQAARARAAIVPVSAQPPPKLSCGLGNSKAPKYRDADGNCS
jgi:uncharacterized protein YqfA (UPF0365 family)